MHGAFMKYLDVNLSSRAIGEYGIPEEWIALHLGGKGIAARILITELRGGEAPLSEGNILVFATGPFQGTGVTGGGRHVVMGLSPKTGSVSEAYVGGYFGDALAHSGYDGILLRGIADDPLYLALIDGKASLHPADALWGRGTGATEAKLLEQYPRSRVASIGPAGERQVQMACIISDHSRAAGRPGFGAVMGSKRLKAVVVRGDQTKPLRSPKRFQRERAAHAKTFKTEGFRRFGEYGTPGLILPLNVRGTLPTKNFQEGIFEQAKAISGEALHERLLVGRETCSGCPIRCKRVVSGSFGNERILPEFGGPEYETIAALGSLCMNENLDSIALANQLCNDYGIDTISAGVAIAFLMEASEKGLIEDPVDWGDAKAIIALLHQIGRREGFGERVALGLDALAGEIGADFQMTIKGQEVPMHEPRGKKGLGISYATSPRGATHMEGIHDTELGASQPTPELGVIQPYDRFTLSDKPAVIKLYEDLRSFTNSLILCCFTVSMVGEGYNLPGIRSLLESATGIALSPVDMLAVGERNYALMRLHAARAGYSTDSDSLPRRFATPLVRGASAGQVLEQLELKAAITDYYGQRGYDWSGPTDATLKRLGLRALVGVISR